MDWELMVLFECWPVNSNAMRRKELMSDTKEKVC